VQWFDGKRVAAQVGGSYRYVNVRKIGQTLLPGICTQCYPNYQEKNGLLQSLLRPEIPGRALEEFCQRIQMRNIVFGNKPGAFYMPDEPYR
jgi:hypothetical protein